MYHIKSDKRSRTSAKLICDAMLQCLREQPFSEITIVDLQKTSSVGRSTFYRLFDRTEDVLEYLYEQRIQNIYNGYHQLPEEHRPSFLLYILKDSYTNSDILEVLIKNNLIHLMQKIHNKYIPFYIREELGNDSFISATEDYACSMFSSLVVGIISVWIRHNKRETPEELYYLLRTYLQTLARIS